MSKTIVCVHGRVKKSGVCFLALAEPGVLHNTRTYSAMNLFEIAQLTTWSTKHQRCWWSSDSGDVCTQGAATRSSPLVLVSNGFKTFILLKLHSYLGDVEQFAFRHHGDRTKHCVPRCFSQHLCHRSGTCVRAVRTVILSVRGRENMKTTRLVTEDSAPFSLWSKYSSKQTHELQGVA